MTGNHVTIDEACARAARVLSAARRERGELAARGGPEAVAEAAYVPGGPSKPELAALYVRLQAETARDPAA